MFGWQAMYAHARNQEQKGNWHAAVSLYRRLVTRGQDDNPKVHFRLGHALFRIDRLDEAIPHLERAVELAPENASWHYRLAFVHERTKNFSAAVQHYDAALHLDPEQTKWFERQQKCVAALNDQKSVEDRRLYRAALETVIGAKGPAWERLDALEAGYASHKRDVTWLRNLAKARFDMNRFEDAAHMYSEVLGLQPKDAESHFMCGWAWQNCGRAIIATKHFGQAIALDTRHGATNLGIGAFYQSKGQWRLAAEAYKDMLIKQPENAELNFRAGLSLQKIYNWKDAEKFLGRAILLNPIVPVWHYRRGLSFERLGTYDAAAQCYETATRAGRGNRYWSYRLGHVRAKNGDFTLACEAYEKSYSLPGEKAPVVTEAERPVNGHELERALADALADALESQSGQLCYVVGARAESAGILSVAEDAYRAAIARAEDHQPHLHYSLGRVLAAQGKWLEGAKAYSEVRIFGRAFGVDVDPYLKSDATRKSMTYLEYVENVAIDDSVIVYESGHGASVSCNPLAMYRRTAMDERFREFTHVWVLNDITRVPTELRNRPNVIFVRRESDLYLRYIASAKYLINNNTFPPYFTRRDGQEYLNTWHGTPLKTLGRDIKSGVMDHKNAARNFLQATHMIFPNRFTADCLINKYDIAELYSGELALTGYPRNDSTVSMPADAQESLRDRLGISQDKKIVLYAPTWRGTLANKSMDVSRLADDLESLSGGDWHFLYRGHSVNEEAEIGSVSDRFGVPFDLDTNDLLSIVDVLVTDYSSILFDFMATGRPIVYYAYDLAEYESERGLYFDLADLGGSVCADMDSTLNAIENALKVEAPRGESVPPMMREFHQLEHGESSKRAIEFFFFGNKEYSLNSPANGRPNALMYAGSFIPNGVTSSYLNLVSQLPADSHNIHIAVDPVTVSSDPHRQEKFGSMPDHVRALGRVGIHLVTPEERWVIDKFNTQHRLDSEEMWEIYSRAHRREFRRMFGEAKFDAIVCFEGYARFWASLLGNPIAKPKVSSIYLHSVMKAEWHNRFPYLEGVFRLYRYFDNLLSVSESASDINAHDLSTAFGLSRQSFTYMNNVLNPAQALEGSLVSLDEDLDNWLGSVQQKVFVSVGRLSPEKGHLKLVSGFAKVVAEHPDARLVIVGDGPMMNKIVDLIEDLGLSNSVYLAGMRMNPYSIVERADCFVFSSDYEGQGIAILEAMILGKPVVSTDVTGARSVLQGGHGLLVENSPQGLSDGMLRYLNENPVFSPFDFETYQKEGVEAFRAIALDGLDPDRVDLMAQL